MKPYAELTRLGRLRRLRGLAEIALEEYGLTGARLTFTHSGGNVIFRADVPGPAAVTSEHDPFVPNRYNLRILSTGDAEAIASELTWLTALSREAGLPVPEPVPTLDGRLLTTITTPGVPRGTARLVDALGGWASSQQRLAPASRRAWGRLVARCTSFRWAGDRRKGSTGRIGTGTDSWAAGISAIDGQSWWRRCPDHYREPFELVSQPGSRGDGGRWAKGRTRTA